MSFMHSIIIKKLQSSMFEERVNSLLFCLLNVIIN